MARAAWVVGMAVAGCAFVGCLTTGAAGPLAAGWPERCSPKLEFGKHRIDPELDRPCIRVDSARSGLFGDRVELTVSTEGPCALRELRLRVNDEEFPITGTPQRYSYTAAAFDAGMASVWVVDDCGHSVGDVTVEFD